MPRTSASRGGYADYTRTDRSEFKNAGECVSYVARGGTLEPIRTAVVTIQSVTWRAQFNSLSVDFIATGFSPNSPLQDNIISFPHFAINVDYADFIAQSTDANGVFDWVHNMSASKACVEGAPGSITITDSAGNTATGHFTMACS